MGKEWKNILWWTWYNVYVGCMDAWDWGRRDDIWGYAGFVYLSCAFPVSYFCCIQDPKCLRFSFAWSPVWWNIHQIPIILGPIPMILAPHWSTMPVLQEPQRLSQSLQDLQDLKLRHLLRSLAQKWCIFFSGETWKNTISLWNFKNAMEKPKTLDTFFINSWCPFWGKSRWLMAPYLETGYRCPWRSHVGIRISLSLIPTFLFVPESKSTWLIYIDLYWFNMI